MREEREGLVGMFFHSVGENGELEWQGVVTRNPEPGWYVVHTFDWMTGTPGWHQTLVRLESMTRWMLYDTAETMKDSFEYGPARDFRKK